MTDDQLQQAFRSIGVESLKAMETGKMNPNVTIARDQLVDFCQKRGIRKLAVFGSALGEDFGPESDVDVLVEFYPSRIPTLFDMAGMAEELSALFGGRKVDLRTPEDLSRYFRDKVLAEAEVQYAAG